MVVIIKALHYFNIDYGQVILNDIKIRFEEHVKIRVQITGLTPPYLCTCPNSRH